MKKINYMVTQMLQSDFVLSLGGDAAWTIDLMSMWMSPYIIVCSTVVGKPPEINNSNNYELLISIGMWVFIYRWNVVLYVLTFYFQPMILCTYLYLHQLLMPLNVPIVMYVFAVLLLLQRRLSNCNNSAWVFHFQCKNDEYQSANLSHIATAM